MSRKGVQQQKKNFCKLGLTENVLIKNTLNDS